jgi:hypothetical protein
MLRLQGYAPEPAEGKNPRRPIEERESYRWLQAYEDAVDAPDLDSGDVRQASSQMRPVVLPALAHRRMASGDEERM